MTPLMEEKDEEHEDVYVRTLVVEVPPLGQPTERTKPKNRSDLIVEFAVGKLLEDGSPTASLESILGFVE
jgi:hypothetical protein